MKWMMERFHKQMPCVSCEEQVVDRSDAALWLGEDALDRDSLSWSPIFLVFPHLHVRKPTLFEPGRELAGSYFCRHLQGRSHGQ